MSALLHHLEDLQRCARRVLNKGKLNNAHVCRLHDEMRALGPQLGDHCFKIVNGQADMIIHPSVNLSRDGERHAVELAGLKNGELLLIAEDNGIEVLLTGDQTLAYEQNLTARRLGIVALSAIQLPIIKT